MTREMLLQGGNVPPFFYYGGIIMKYKPKKTDHSSKYGLKPEQFEKDEAENQRKHADRKQRF